MIYYYVNQDMWFCYVNQDMWIVMKIMVSDFMEIKTSDFGM